MTSRYFDICVVGGGAAGFFAAISAKAQRPELKVALLEKTDKLLSKVLVSGGGRCNVTHHCLNNKKLVEFYPRGADYLKEAFTHFSVPDTIRWFESRGVKLKVEADGRMFPVSNSSSSIANCLLREAAHTGVEILKKQAVLSLKKTDSGFLIQTVEGSTKAKQVIVCSGGGVNPQSLDWIKELGIGVTPLHPSLFTFNMPDNPIRELAGVSVAKGGVRLLGQSDFQQGALLITHWGLSGPAALRLSAWEAVTLVERNYQCVVEVNWTPFSTMEEVKSALLDYAAKHPKKQIVNSRPIPEIPERLWEYICSLTFQGYRNWAELGKKSLELLCRNLFAMPHEVKGKTRFKEEFVTCGGVDLTGVDPHTGMAKELVGLYFAGEVLNIDGITGGFNFQAAWTTGYIAGKQSGLRA